MSARRRPNPEAYRQLVTALRPLFRAARHDARLMAALAELCDAAAAHWHVGDDTLPVDAEKE